MSAITWAQTTVCGIVLAHGGRNLVLLLLFIHFLPYIRDASLDCSKNLKCLNKSLKSYICLYFCSWSSWSKNLNKGQNLKTGIFVTWYWPQMWAFMQCRIWRAKLMERVKRYSHYMYSCKTDFNSMHRHYPPSGLLKSSHGSFICPCNSKCPTCGAKIWIWPIAGTSQMPTFFPSRRSPIYVGMSQELT